MRLERTQEFDRSPEVVFDFVATNHVRNHPRWDPGMHIEQITDGPIGVGTVFKRRQDRGAGPIEGTMTVVAFEPNRSWMLEIHDGPLEMQAGFFLQPRGNVGCTMTLWVDVPSMTQPIDPAPFERSLVNMKRLIEAET